MKKSELKEYIREAIIAELTPQDKAAGVAAKAAIDDTVKDLSVKANQTTDVENKKAAVAALTAAKTKQALINKAVSTGQAVSADLLPEGEDDDDDSEKEPTKADLKKAEKELGIDIPKVKKPSKLSAEEKEKFDIALKGITAKVNRIKNREAKPDDLTLLKKAYGDEGIKKLFKKAGENLDDLVAGIIGGGDTGSDLIPDELT